MNLFSGFVAIVLALAYRQYSKSKELAAAEELARKEKRGLWADKEPEPPWEFRKKEKSVGNPKT